MLIGGGDAFAIQADHRGAYAKVDLCLLARHALHAAKGHRLALAEVPYKSADTVIAATKTVFTDQILVNPPARQPQLELVFDGLLEGLTKALGT